MVDVNTDISDSRHTKITMFANYGVNQKGAKRVAQKCQRR
jgi:hypothetical protein